MANRHLADGHQVGESRLRPLALQRNCSGNLARYPFVAGMTLNSRQLAVTDHADSDAFDSE